MEIEIRQDGGLVTIVGLMMHPGLAEIPPGENRENGLLLAVEYDKLSLFLLDGGDPMAPFLHAQQDRDATAQVSAQFLSRLLSVEPAGELEIAVKLAGCLRELKFVCARPPTRSRNLGDLVFIGKDAKHDKRMLEGKRSALPQIRLRVESHRTTLPA